jgi:predicted secreted hydrolase
MRTLAVAVAVVGCSGPILANAPAPRLQPPAIPSPPGRPVDPQPIVLPRDDAPHHRLTEWWYYTGHLRGRHGERFGFEFVVFRAERGGFPVSWASHLALTDETAGRFRYAQRSEIGTPVDRSVAMSGMGAGFAFSLSGGGLGGVPAMPATSPWLMTGNESGDRLVASAGSDETAHGAGAFGIDLSLGPGAVMIHDRDGFIDFGVGGSSYYYSRPSQPVIRGQVTVEGKRVPVTGQAWFDHQWGDFVFMGGGWDWFAIELSDGRSIMLSLVRGAEGDPLLVYGTVSARRPLHLSSKDFRIQVKGRWHSPWSGADYPAGWRVVIPRIGLSFDLQPTVADQELDTRASSGAVYWEGSQVVKVRAIDADGRPTKGRTPSAEAYVELTGYAPQAATGLPSSPRP